MIVDDEPINRFMLSGLLENYEGLEAVAEASNGLEAVELAKSSQPEIIIMDVTMPEMDGISATKAIKAELPGVKILIHSSMNKKADVEQAFEAGASGFFSKGSKAVKLVDALKAVYQGQTFLEI